MSLELVKRHGSRNWYLRGSVRGRLVDRSTKTADKQAAEAIRIKTENQLLNSSIFGERATVTFLQAAVTYMREGGEARFMEPIIAHFKTRLVAELGQEDIDAAARVIYPNGSNATRNRQIYTPVSAVLQLAAKRGWRELINLDRPKQPKGRIRWISHDEARQLVECCKPHLKPIVIFLLGTGARASEMSALQWSDVDMKRAHVVFRNTKNDEHRGVPLSPTVVSALANLHNRVGWVFLTHKGKPYTSKDNGGNGIKNAFATACELAKITDFTPHDCRHTFATWHYAAHRDLGQLQQLLGHKSVVMTMRYAHINVGHLASSVNSIGW